MLFSVIIPTFNRKDLLEKAIYSVLNQSYQKFEIIIVDNYSIDNTIQMIEQLNERRITTAQLRNDGIIAKSRNYAARKATGEYLAFLDSDDLWDTDKLLKCAELIKATKADVVYHDLRTVTDAETNKSSNLVKSYQMHGSDFKWLKDNGNAIPFSSAVVNTKRFLSIGGFDEAANLPGAEDYDLWLRLAQQSTHFERLNYVLGSYRKLDNFSSNPRKVIKNLNYLRKKWSWNNDQLPAWYMKSLAGNLRRIGRKRIAAKYNIKVIFSFKHRNYRARVRCIINLIFWFFK